MKALKHNIAHYLSHILSTSLTSFIEFQSKIPRKKSYQILKNQKQYIYALPHFIAKRYSITKTMRLKFACSSIYGYQRVKRWNWIRIYQTEKIVVSISIQVLFVWPMIDQWYSYECSKLNIYERILMKNQDFGKFVSTDFCNLLLWLKV